MRKGRMAATRFFIIVIVLMTFFVLSGPTVFARQGPPQVPSGKDIVDENKEDKHEDKNRGWDKVVEKFIENGITFPAHVNNGLFDYVREALKEDEDLIPMVMVGEPGIDYVIPTGIAQNPGESDDMRRATVTGGYNIAQHETTYELWYEVRIWAEANGYQFKYVGREGSQGIIGEQPTERKYEPVTTITYQDVIVWTNAISEMHGYEPVYRSADGSILKDAYRGDISYAVQSDTNGYRLPSYYEWEMAARWKNDTVSTDGSIYVEGRYWTPSYYASGATQPISSLDALDLVAWYRNNSGEPDGILKTHAVGLKVPNHLNIFDMSGNVEEYIFMPNNDSVCTKGGSYLSHAYYLAIGSFDFHSPPASYEYNALYIGFRLVRVP